MGKGILHLSIDANILALIKAKDDMDSISEFVENLFKVELEISTDDKTNELGELKIMNAKLSAECEKLKIEASKLKKVIKEAPPKKERIIYAGSEE